VGLTGGGVCVGVGKGVEVGVEGEELCVGGVEDEATVVPSREVVT